MNFYADEKQIKIHSQFTYSQHCIVLIRDGHADIFSDTHRCGYSHYPYVRYSHIYAAHISDRRPIRIRLAIPSIDTSFIFDQSLRTASCLLTRLLRLGKRWSDLWYLSFKMYFTRSIKIIISWIACIREGPKNNVFFGKFSPHVWTRLPTPGFLWDLEKQKVNFG